MEEVSSSRYLGSCSSIDEGTHEDVKIRVSEGLKTLGAIKMKFSVGNVKLGMTR